ncbi:acyl carrier protein [Streptomyces sanyensis]|uniref:acyl carrier protein n=1 Tax=Streptomyces sanyensis TaxID=568869 RepID=UPI003D77B471
MTAAERMPPATPPEHAARDEADRALREVIAGILPALPPQEVVHTRHLKDLGADSVDRVEIIAGVTARLGLDVPMGRFSDIPDIGALVGFLADCLDRSRRTA